MNEGDIAIVFSEFGEIVDVNLVRDKVTGQSKGFAFLAYEDQRSTILAVDNFNGIDLCGRTIKVDHVRKYKPPREYMDLDSKLFEEDYRPTGPDGRGWGKFRKLND
jgi:RNA-binding motif X-linked protein 2